jgi:hypothetical protein
LAEIATREPFGLATTAGAAGTGATGFLIFGATVDLRAGAGAVSLVAGAGVFSVLVFFFMMRRWITLGTISPTDWWNRSNCNAKTQCLPEFPGPPPVCHYIVTT